MESRMMSVPHPNEPMTKQPKVMTYNLLLYANERSIELGYNRNIEIDNFIEAVGQYGVEPETAYYPVKALMLHKHADGEPTDPHMRVMVIGPEGVSVILDCPLDIYAKLPYIDMNTGGQVNIN